MPKGGSTTQETKLDPQTQAYVQQMRRAALGYAGIGAPTTSAAGYPSRPGFSGLGGNAVNGGNLSPIAPNLPPAIAQAQQNYGNYAQAGNLGLGALTGQAGAQQAFMNPYQNAMNPFFAQQRAGAVQGANDQATLAGSFGGDRSQIGAATAGNYADQNQAQFQYQGFQDAMQRAQQAANLGFGAIGAQAFLPQQYAQGQLGLLNAGLGPYGQTTTTQQHQDPFQTAVGLGLTAASFYPPTRPFAMGAQGLMGSPGYGGNFG